MTDTPCPRCGQPHPNCSAHSKQRGTPCGRSPVPGATVCYLHGGRAPQVQAKAAARIQEHAAAIEVARFGARRDIHPADALLDLVHWTAGEVDYWRQRVTELDADELEWGTTKHEHGYGAEGPIDKKTEAATPHVAYTMLERASDRLAAYAAAALKAGVDERRVRLAETQGALVADVIRRILDRLSLSDEQVALVGTVVPEELRAIAGGAA